MKFKIILLTSLLAMGLMSCVQNEVLPTQLVGNAQFGKESVKLANTGETVSVAVNANCDWTISADASWIKLSPLNGTAATKDFTLSVEEENNSDDPRDGHVYIITEFDSVPCDTLLVTQKGKGSIGDGKLRNAEDFLAFLDAAPVTTAEDLFELAEDIDMEGNVIVPASEFSGVFDGKDHKVYNFTVSSESNVAAIIGTNKGTIRNVVFGSSDGKTYDGKTTISFNGSTGAYAGLVGTNNGLIDNVVNFAKIDFNAATGGTDNAAGGIAGCMGTPEAVISNCHNYGSISLTGNMGARASLGGILGFSGVNGATLKNCVNHASVSKADDIEAEFAMGGVAGRANDALNLEECQNEGPVSFDFAGSVKSYVHIGGIIGAAYKGCTFTKCTNKGSVSSSINQVNRAAGIAGTLNTGATVVECVNEGDISIAGVDGNANWQGIGGICGLEEKATDSSPLTIRNSTNKGGIVANFVNNSTTHANGMAVGGIIGVTSSYARIEANTNSGDITASNTGAGMLNVGGIFGFYRNATSGTTLETKDNVNAGKVTVSASNGAAGGIFGYDSFASNNHTGDKNQGEVNFDNASATGSIAGNNTANITGCTVGGSVNGVKVDGTNFSSYIQGSISSGKALGCMPDGGSAEPYINVAATVKFDAAGETKSVDVASNGAWTVVSDQSWLTVGVSEGDASVTAVSLTAAANSGAERTATVTFTSKEKSSVKAEVTVTQDADAGVLVDNKIASAANLKTFLKLASSAADTDTYTITADINCNGETLSPAESFAGILDGQNHKVYNFKLASEATAAGLILNNTGTVKNLVVGSSNGTSWDGTSIINFASSATGVLSAGFIAVNGGVIDNVVNFASVDMNTATSASVKAGVGGIAGTTGNATAEIKNCKNYGTVTLTGTMGNVAGFGGILGYSVQKGSSVTSCSNYADVVKSTKSEKELTMGGVVGRSDDMMTVSGCANEGAVSYICTENPGSYVHTAGIIGAAYKGCTIENCTNKGTVTSKILQVNRLGGICGTMNTGGLIKGCTNNGKLVIDQAANSNWQSVGGICGFEEKGTADVPTTFTDNTNNGEIECSFANNTTHANKIAVGGLIGTTCSFTKYKGNVNNGGIKVTNTDSVGVYAGGIIGWYIKGTALSTDGNTNYGSIAVTAKAGGVGGVIGRNNIASVGITADRSCCTIAAEGLDSGAVAGSNAGSITDCGAGGSVNGTTVTESNLATIAVGANSGTVTGTYLFAK